MQRRGLLSGLCLLLGGCVGQPRPTLGTESGTERRSAGSGETGTSSVERRVRDCERAFIRSERVEDDEQVEGGLHPTVESTESRTDGVYASVTTSFGTVRSRDGEPDEHADYLVEGYYLVTADRVYRTDDPEADPRDGEKFEC